MAPQNHHPHFTFIVFFLIYSSIVCGADNSTSERNNITDVKVGVILNTSSLTGGLSWSCMQLALDDFYEKHPNYSTRISLVLRDLKNNQQDGSDDAFGAAVAGDIDKNTSFSIVSGSSAVDLLKNVQVHAIIGPQTSNQAKFIIALGNKSNVPIISFQAEFPSNSFSQTPYFFRTYWNDSSQAAVIASIAEKFNWREVVVVFEDTDSGNMFVSYLVNTLQGVDAYIPYRCKLPSMASDSKINATLNYLQANRTRVFVIHMSYNLALKFFTIAKENNMDTDEFVWITTYALTDIVDLVGTNASNVMQGVLGIRPVVPNKSFKDVSMKLRKKYQVNIKPTVFGLWAYDTVWLLAESVEQVKHVNLSIKASNAPYPSTDFSKIGISQMGPMLKVSIESTKFSGISGDFMLVNGQLQSGPFVITKVDNGSNTPVGNWTQDNIFINWPGKNRTAPKGWQWPTTGRELLIGVPNKPGFPEFVQPDNNSPHYFSGYTIKVFKAAIDQLPYNVPYKFEQYNNSYDELVYQVYLKKYDAVVGDITILANRSLYADFTLPYTESGVRMVVQVRDVNRKSPWAFLEPWTAKLWLTTGSFFLLTGITIWLMEHRVNNEFRGDPANQVGSVFYFVFSTLVFAHRERMVSNLSRLVVIVWVFVVLILQQSYTASLTSKLTVEQLQPTVTNLEQVIKARQNVGYLEGSFMPGLLKRLGVNESKIIPLSSPDEYNDAISNGTVAVVVDEIPYLKVFLKKYSKNYTMVGPTYKSDGFGFAFPKGSPLVPDVSRAILKVMESDSMTKFDQELYGNNTFTDKEDTTSSTSLTFRSFMGLFIITGASSFLALIIHIIFSVYQRNNSPTKIEAAQNSPNKDEPNVDESNGHRTTTPIFTDNVEISVPPGAQSDIEEIPTDDGTSDRDIEYNDIEMLSFGDMLKHTEEA